MMEQNSRQVKAPVWLGYVVTVFLVAALTAGLVLINPVFPLGKYPIPYVLLTMIVAYFFGGGPSIVAGIVGWFAFTSLFAMPGGFTWPSVDSPDIWARQAAFFLGVTVVAIAAIQVRKANRRIQQLADELGSLNKNLREEITEREYAEEEIKQFNAELEQRVNERTAELQASNQELQAAYKEMQTLSYSLMHDLRTPLRAMGGFSNALLKHYADSLDARGQDYLQRIGAAAQKMSQIIDDIHDLIRATRAKLHREDVDMSAMAVEILQGFRQSQPERRAEITVEPNLIANADPGMLRVVLNHLLGNAWKFTSNQEVTRIEVTSVRLNGRRVYLIRDNGVGFDPAYAGKLFTPFQRLHSESEFPGTGIGLALAERILRRHGGQIWAESEVDKGASFYFTFEEFNK